MGNSYSSADKRIDHEISAAKLEWEESKPGWDLPPASAGFS